MDALITRVYNPYLEIVSASDNEENIFKKKDRVKLAGHYCEEVINSKERLRVGNALEEKEWEEAPELEHGLTAYLGLPLLWPNGNVFGTICVHGKKGTRLSDKLEDMMFLIKELIESHLMLRYQKENIQQSYAEKNIILNSMNEYVVYQKRDGRIIWANKAAAESLNMEIREMVGEYCYRLWHNRDTRCEGCPAVKTINTGKAAEGVVVGENGRYWNIKTSPVFDEDGNITGVVEVTEDITEKKEKEEEIEYLLNKDPLTDVYNRRFFEEEMARLDTKRKLPLSIILGDLDGLKMINNSFGYKKGDNVLKETAQMLKGKLREKDILARYGGDEFIILLPETTESQAQKIIKRINKENKNFKVDEIPVSISLGVATKNNEKEDIETILIDADDDMYKNKLTEGRGTRSKIVQNLINTLGVKSSETKEHAMRMTSLSYKLGEKIGLSYSELNRLSLLATLHDIGKVTIAENILTKPGKLSKEEWEIIKEHPERGIK